MSNSSTKKGTMGLTSDDLFKIYSWFDFIRGSNGDYLEESDHELAKEIRKELLKNTKQAKCLFQKEIVQEVGVYYPKVNTKKSIWSC